MAKRPWKFPEKRAREVPVTCAHCGRAGGAHACDHGVPCGQDCDRCLEVDLFSLDGDERVEARRSGLYEVEVKITGTFSRDAFRRIASAIRADWEVES